MLADDGSAAAVGCRFEKVAPDDGDFTRAYELIQAIDAAPTPARSAALRDLFDVPALIEVLAVGTIVQHWDTTVHNFQLLRDGSTGRWRFVATDYDLTMAGPVRPSLFPYGPDNLVSALRSDPVLSDLYLRRVRTLADTYLAGGRPRAAARRHGRGRRRRAGCRPGPLAAPARHRRPREGRRLQGYLEPARPTCWSPTGAPTRCRRRRARRHRDHRGGPVPRRGRRRPGRRAPANPSATEAIDRQRLAPRGGGHGHAAAGHRHPRRRAR